jgi:hypothetical protein
VSDTATDETTAAPAAEYDDDGDEQDADMLPHDPDDDSDDDDDTDSDDDGEAQARASSEALIRENMGKIARSAETFRRRVSDVLGEDALALVPCELCEPEIPGFHWPAELAYPRDEIHARLLEVLRTPSAPEYVADPGHKMCDACHGYGKVRTGSKVPGQEIGTCGPCRGYGFVPPPGVNVQTGEIDAAAGVHEAAPQDFGPPADRDPWGSPRILPDGQENPNYGRMPQFKNPSLP